MTVVQKKMTRKQREQERHRNEILDAAERVFSRNGFRASSVTDIAREAEFAVGTLYNFFESKEHLYQELFLRKVGEIDPRIRAEVAAVKDPRKKIERLIDTNLYFVRKYRDFFLLHMNEVIGVLKPIPLPSPEVRRRYEDFIGFVAGVISDGIKKRVFEKCDPMYAAISLIGIVHNCGAMWISGKAQAEMKIEELADFAKRMFFTGMLKSK